jgi:hypothetical protein
MENVAAANRPNPFEDVGHEIEELLEIAASEGTDEATARRCFRRARERLLRLQEAADESLGDAE